MRLTLCLVAMLVAGCNAMKLTYNHADTALAWMADDYLALAQPQEAALRDGLDRLLSWHRRDELPQYAQAFRKVQSQVEKGLQRQDIVWLIETSRAEYDQVLQQAAADAARVLATVTPEQIENLEKKFTRDNAKFDKEYLRGSPDKQRDRRTGKTLERIEHWVGELSFAQAREVRERSRAMPLTYELWRDDRIRKQREFVALLRKNENPGELTQGLRRWHANWRNGRSEEYQRATDALTEHSVELVLALDKMITPAQRIKVVSRLQSYIDDFEELAKKQQSTKSQPVAN